MLKRSLLMTKLLLLATALCVTGIACNDPASSDNTNNSPIIETESWEVNDDNGRGKNEIEMRLHEDTTFSCGGTWIIKDWFSAAYVECKIEKGIVTKDGENYRIVCSGTASWPEQFQRDAPPSPFVLKLDGTFADGTSSGEWSLGFFHEDWADWPEEQGSFSGTLIEGEGITE
jgi:hypothetical protein